MSGTVSIPTSFGVVIVGVGKCLILGLVYVALVLLVLMTIPIQRDDGAVCWISRVALVQGRVMNVCVQGTIEP